MPFIFSSTQLPDVTKISAESFTDERGSFVENFKASDFAAHGIENNFVQDNAPVSKKGVLRGLHYQLPPHAQGKLVGVIKGKIFDVAVDIRKSSPTFGKWVGEELSDENHTMLYIPAGFAHGFMALEDDTRVVYKMNGNEYHQPSERGIRFDDPAIGIIWPLENPILSEKDKIHPLLRDVEVF